MEQTRIAVLICIWIIYKQSIFFGVKQKTTSKHEVVFNIIWLKVKKTVQIPHAEFLESPQSSNGKSNSKVVPAKLPQVVEHHVLRQQGVVAPDINLESVRTC